MAGAGGPTGSDSESAHALAYSVVIPTKDRPLLVAEAVERMLGQTRRPERIVVVDASEPPFEPPPELVRHSREAGVDLRVEAHAPSTAAQRNVGVALVETPVVLFLDDDLEVDEHYADALVRRWEREGLERLGGVAPTALGPSQTTIERVVRRLVMLQLGGRRQAAHVEAGERVVPAVEAGAVAFRTDLVRRHRFDERFHGSAPGETLDMSFRLAQEAPIVQVADAVYRDLRPRDGPLAERWYLRGRRGTYFRLQHAGRGARAIAAFALSLAGETSAAVADSLRERDAAAVRSYVRGLARTMGEFQSSRLKPHAYYAAGHRFQRARIRSSRRRAGALDWTGVRILGYHRVSADRDALAVAPGEFRSQLELALEHGLVPLSLTAALDHLRQPVDGRFFCVTFDDGYRDVLENAVPALRELGIPATVFVATAVVDGDARFAWYRSSPPVMGWDELRELSSEALFDVQAHGRSHRLLTRLGDEEVRREFVDCKRELEARLSAPATSFCYPAGLYGEREVRLLREAGYRAGVTCDPGVAQAGTPVGRLPRTMISSLDRRVDFEAKLRGLLDERSGLGSWLHRRRSAAEPPAPAIHG